MPAPKAAPKPRVYTDRNADPAYITALTESYQTRMNVAAERDALRQKLAKTEDPAERQALEGEIAAKTEEMLMIQQAAAELVRARMMMERADRAAVEEGRAVDNGARPARVAEKLDEYRRMVEAGEAKPLPKWDKQAFLAGAQE